MNAVKTAILLCLEERKSRVDVALEGQHQLHFSSEILDLTLRKFYILEIFKKILFKMCKVSYVPSMVAFVGQSLLFGALTY